MKILQAGDTGLDVLELQRMLVGWGTKEHPVVLDRKFDEVTAAALERFRRAHNMKSGGICDNTVFEVLEAEKRDHPFDINAYKCSCGACGGFGRGEFRSEYKYGKPRVEAYYLYEYPGIDVTLIWAVRALMHRAHISQIRITSGYRCWHDNIKKGRLSTNHLGKAVDFITTNNENLASREHKIRECDYIRMVAVEECGFQPGWSLPNRVSVEMPEHGADTWVHIDTRMIPADVRKHVIYE